MSAFDFPGLELRLPSIVTRALEGDACSDLDFKTLKLVPCQYEGMAQWEATSVRVRRLISILVDCLKLKFERIVFKS